MLFWSTSYACPVCRQEDYQVVLGQCINGEQDIIYIPPKYVYAELSLVLGCTVDIFKILFSVIWGDYIGSHMYLYV